MGYHDEMRKVREKASPKEAERKSKGGLSQCASAIDRVGDCKTNKFGRLGPGRKMKDEQRHIPSHTVHISRAAQYSTTSMQ